jgi:hypothetical protein
LRKTRAFFFPAKLAPRAPGLPSHVRIFRETPLALAAILAPVSSGLTAAAVAIATIAVEIIAVVVAADPTGAVADPAAVLASNVADLAGRTVITVATPDLRAVLSSFLKC